MYFKNQNFEFYLMILILILVQIVICDQNLNTNQLTGDDFEKRGSVKHFFDSLVAGSNQNTKTSAHTPSTPRPDGPIYMPFAVPVHSPPPSPQGPHVHIAPPPSFGYSSNINSIYRPPPPQPRPHLHITPIGQSYGQSSSHHHHHGHNHGHNHNHNHHNHHNYHNFGNMSPINHNFGAQSHHYPIPSHPSTLYDNHNHFDFGQHTRPIAIAIPLPLHAIPLHLFPNHETDGHKPNPFLPNPEFNDLMNPMSPTTKFTLFADPYEDVVDDDIYENNANSRFKFIPVPKND